MLMMAEVKTVTTVAEAVVVIGGADVGTDTVAVVVGVETKDSKASSS